MLSKSAGIRIVVINGSVRPGNYTSMASTLVVDELEKDPEVTVHLINPEDYHLPFPGANHAEGTKRLQEEVKNATAVVLATPEYHGSFSSVMKLVIENLGFPSVLSGKPVALLGVAAGQIGAIKSLEALGSVCADVGAIVLPGPVSVAKVREVFDSKGRCLDSVVEKQIRSVATNLIDYIRGNICPRVALESGISLRKSPGGAEGVSLRGFLRFRTTHRCTLQCRGLKSGHFEDQFPWVAPSPGLRDRRRCGHPLPEGEGEIHTLER